MLLRLVVLCGLCAAPVSAECRLALALAMDVSRSIDAADFVIQTEGLATALEDPEVRTAILGPEGQVALAIYQWSGPGHQDLIQDWVVVDGQEALDRVVWAVRGARPPDVQQLTALGQAMLFGAELLARAPDCDRRVLDVAGDGQNNAGVSVSNARARPEFDGITINGLAVGEHEQGLVAYFRKEVIGGTGAFVEVAPRQTDYPPAIRRKLLRELEGPQIGGLKGTRAPRG